MAIILASTQNNNKYADGRNEFDEMNKFVNRLISLGQPREKTNIGISNNNMNHGVNIAKKYKNSDNMLISNHSNAGGGTGTQIYYHKGSANGYNLAISLSNILKLYKIKASVRHDCKPYTDYDTGFMELRETPQPAILVEWFFHDNLFDIKWWENNQNNCLKAVCDLIGLVYKDEAKKLLTMNDICWECLSDGDKWRDKFASLGKDVELAIQKIYYHNKNLK